MLLKLISQKKTILKMESEITKLKEAFGSLRDEYASLVSEKFVNPPISYLREFHPSMIVVGCISLVVRLVLACMKRLNL